MARAKLGAEVSNIFYYKKQSSLNKNYLLNKANEHFINKILQNKIMVGSMNIKIKMMPSSPNVNFDGIKKKAKSVVENNKGKNISFEEEPIAFGLKALIVYFILPEDAELEIIENKLGELENVNSAETIDMRRAI
ncbi:MAG: elongation factor 1-beta [Nanoarchaeota archaeon]